MNIAIFADLHGRILLCFKLVERYQRETGESIDLIIQAGDAAIFPDVWQLDKATKKYAKNDSTELGFSEHFLEPSPEVEAVLSKLDCSMICVRGNHEDHAFLDELEQQSAEALFPVDCYKRISVLKTGVPYCFSASGSSVNLLGIGRVGPPEGTSNISRPKYIQEYEQDRLRALKTSEVDILVSHDSAKNFITPGFGMEEVQTCLDLYKPVYHFYGHTGAPYETRTHTNGISISSKMSDFEWEEDRGRAVKQGSFGVLRWNGPEDHSMRIVDEPWFREYTAYSWKHL
ncbi:MAG: serine/threonine protein phosphatase [bacterium]|nr:serine/threonine protein phosphatase [bacterium]